MIHATRLFRYTVVPAMLAVLSSAAVAATFELTGDAHPTLLTGAQGETFTLGDPNSSEFALYGLLSKERSDEPCWVQVNNESINFSFAKGGAAKSLCGSRGPVDSSLLIADFGDNEFGGEKAFISGVNVCFNRSGDKVKGWTVTGRKIEPDGRLVDLASSTSVARPRCDEYQEAVNCRAGEVATAAIVHYGPGAERQSWIGMQLQCRAVRVKS